MPCRTCGRCVMCYAGHHYQSYALSEELDAWLLFDDTTIKRVSGRKAPLCQLCRFCHG